MAASLCSCTKKDSLQEEVFEFSVEETAYNADMKVLAGALHQAIASNSNLSGVVKKEALKRFDGDVNVLLKDIAPQKVKVETKGGESEVSFADYLTSFLPATKSGENNLIDALQEEYPLLQIAIPVHAEEWDGVSVPKIAFVPENNVESENEPIPAINENGEWIMMSATKEPDEPVIVLSQNERSGDIIILPDSVITNVDLPLVKTPDTPNNLKGEILNDFIYLTWDKVSEAEFYRVYRKGVNEDKYKVVYSGKNEYYSDKSLVANQYYHYCVTSCCLEKSISNNQVVLPKILESAKSDPILKRAPELPDDLSYFNVLCQGTGLEIRWNDDGVPNSKVQILEKYAEDEIDYHDLIVAPSSDVMYNFECEKKGSRVVYQARRKTNVGYSNPSYAFVYPPYRNTAMPSPVIVKSIYMKDVNKVEAWYSGAPEFYVRLYKAAENSNGEYITTPASTEIVFGFKSRTKSQTFNRNIYSWFVTEDLNWKDALDIYMIEGDNDFDMSITAKVSVPICDSLKLDLSFSLAQPKNDKFTTTGQDCGQNTIYYYQKPDVGLVYSHDVTLNLR